MTWNDPILLDFNSVTRWVMHFSNNITPIKNIQFISYTCIIYRFGYFFLPNIIVS